MNCTICGKPIVLVPSAKERAEKCGGSPSDYSKLFTTHDDCFLAQRARETSELIARRAADKPDLATILGRLRFA